MANDIHLNIRFPPGMSDRDKQIILNIAREKMAQTSPRTKEEAYQILQAILGEYLPYQTRRVKLR
ncbi:hypothetical protein [Limnoraphis robusta]|uniref:hypothetical protein n=1 Tax=Limnoraphis robusta TaxID=1118279 RepID=UPI002B2115CF|nr:hypothetical protein [Limnoraphis robusta]MEA5498030.1 hypothetical protein [Limnoraphis robusta BA-68 BA1]